jgi:hypothetical protein
MLGSAPHLAGVDPACTLPPAQQSDISISLKRCLFLRGRRLSCRSSSLFSQLLVCILHASGFMFYMNTAVRAGIGLWITINDYNFFSR